MDDSVFTSVFGTAEECRKYCTGVGAICEETADTTDVDTLDVAD